ARHLTELVDVVDDAAVLNVRAGRRRIRRVGIRIENAGVGIPLHVRVRLLSGVRIDERFANELLPRAQHAAVAQRFAVVQVAEDAVADAARVLLNQSFRLPVAVRILFAVALDLDAWVAHFHAHRYFVDAVRAHGGARIVRVHGRAVEIARAREAHLVAEPPDSNRDRIPVEVRHGANQAPAVRVPGGQASARADM